MVEIVMLVAAGFLVASLCALILAPMLWHRAVRLTEIRVRSLTPLSMAEIQADKDRLRAEFALQLCQLENTVEKLKDDNTSKRLEIVRTSEFAKLRSAEALTGARTVSELDHEMEELRQKLIHAETEAKVNLKALKRGQKRFLDQRKELDELREAARDVSILCDEQKIKIAALQADNATGKEDTNGDNEPAKLPPDATQKILANMAAKVRKSAVLEGELARLNTEHDRLKGELGLARAELSAQKLEIEALRQERTARDRALERKKTDLEDDKGTAPAINEVRGKSAQLLERDQAENEALRERLAEITAEIANMGAALQGGDPVIKKILGKSTPAKKRRAANSAKEKRDGSQAAETARTKTTLADRIRALQAHISTQA